MNAMCDINMTIASVCLSVHLSQGDIVCRGNVSFGCYYVWLSVFTGLKV